MNRRGFFTALAAAAAAFVAPTVAKQVASATPPPVCCDSTIDYASEPVWYAYQDGGHAFYHFAGGVKIVKIGKPIYVATPLPFVPKFPRLGAPL